MTQERQHELIYSESQHLCWIFIDIQTRHKIGWSKGQPLPGSSRTTQIDETNINQTTTHKTSAELTCTTPKSTKLPIEETPQSQPRVDRNQ